MDNLYFEAVENLFQEDNSLILGYKLLILEIDLKISPIAKLSYDEDRLFGWESINEGNHIFILTVFEDFDLCFD